MKMGYPRLRSLISLGLCALAALLAPAAQAQVTMSSLCGAPPAPIPGSIPFQDITTQLGYQALAAPTTDTMSDYIGGFESYCYADDDQESSEGPWATPQLAATVSLPFAFGFSGIYYDGGSLNTPFQVNVWANGLLTFDPSVSFNPFNNPQQLAPPDCTGTEYENGTDINFTVSNGNVSDNFGGFPFLPAYEPPGAPTNALIAPWWGDLSLCPGNGSVGWLLTLDDNNAPMAIFQWTNATASPPHPPCTESFDFFGAFSGCSEEPGSPLPAGTDLPQFTFQVVLHANNDVDLIYGPSSYLNQPACYSGAVGVCTYVSGIQSNLVYPSGGRPPLVDYTVQSFDCNANLEGVGCAPNQFPASGTSYTYKDVFRSVGPDLLVTGITAPGLIPQGGATSVAVQISNGGGSDSSGSNEGQLQFYFSPGGQTPEGAPFSPQTISTPIPSCAMPPLNFQVTLPAGIPLGPGYLIAELIPGPASIDQRPSYASVPVVVGPPVPDLAAEGNLGFSPGAAVSGENVQFSFSVTNVGQVDAAASSYGIYLSQNGAAISANDILLGSGPLKPIPVGQSYSSPPNLSFQIPLTLVTGDYRVGVIVDPNNTLGEADMSNNIAVGKNLLVVTSLGPVIATTSLLDAQVTAPYSAQLLAGGGDGTYQWSLMAGSLPSGLALSSAGVISGQAAQVGTSSFTVKVTDGVGHTAEQSLTLKVDPFEQPLAIVTTGLPGGSTMQMYTFVLAAVGGITPYQWALAPGTGELPVGMNLVSDGSLVGDPQYDQTTSFRVTVTDAMGTVVTSPLYSLTIFSGGTLAVGSTQLPNAVVGTPYSGALHFAGGIGPYLWTVTNIEREPEAPGDPGTPFGSSLQVLGLNFFNDGTIDGTPNQVGVFAITVELTDGEMPAASATGLVLLTISGTTGFSFLTVSLPTADANASYLTTLATNAPASDMVTFEVLNTSLLPTDLAKDTLPPGLVLYSDGSIQGVPLEAGTFSFLVEAFDQTAGGVSTQALSITVTNSFVPSSGCQSAPGGPAFAGLLLLALAGLRHRRR